MFRYQTSINIKPGKHLSKSRSKCKSAIHVTIQSVNSFDNYSINDQQEQNKTVHQQSTDRPKTVTASVSVIKIPRHSRSSSEVSKRCHVTVQYCFTVLFKSSEKARESNNPENNRRETHSSSKTKNDSIEQDYQIMSETKKQQLSSSKMFHHTASIINLFSNKLILVIRKAMLMVLISLK